MTISCCLLDAPVEMAGFQFSSPLQHDIAGTFDFLHGTEKLQEGKGCQGRSPNVSGLLLLSAIITILLVPSVTNRELLFPGLFSQFSAVFNRK